MKVLHLLEECLDYNIKQDAIHQTTVIEISNESIFNSDMYGEIVDIRFVVEEPEDEEVPEMR